jgi:protein TonB
VRGVWLAAVALVLVAVWAWRPHPPAPPPVAARHEALRGPTAEEEGDTGVRTPTPAQAAREGRSPRRHRESLAASPGRRRASGPANAAPGTANKAPQADAHGTASGSPGVTVQGRAGGRPLEAARRAPSRLPPPFGDSPGTGQGGRTRPGPADGAAGGPSESAGPTPQAGHEGDGAAAGEPPPERPGPHDPGAESAPTGRPTLVPPTPLYAPLPEHPGPKVTVDPPGGFPSASAVGRQGRVQVRLLVRADGTVGRVDVLASSGDPELDRAAVVAVSRWRFDPARWGGTPVDSYYVVWVRFVVGP